MGLGRVATQTLTFMLTPRDLDVLKLVVQGLSNPDIAERRLAVSISHRYPGERGARAQPLLPRRSRGRGRAHRAGVSLARPGICRGRVKLAGTGEATTLPAVYHWSILLRGAGSGRAGRPSVSAKNLVAAPDDQRGMEDHACQRVSAQTRRDRDWKRQATASWPTSARPEAGSAHPSRWSSMPLAPG